MSPYSMMRASHARVAQGDRVRSTSFGPRSPHAPATKAAADEARKVADDPQAPADVRVAARAIVNSHEYRVPCVGLHVELVLTYLHSQHRQDRYGK